MHRGDLTDVQWERLQPLLPPQRRGAGTTGGRPSNDHRPIINGILWILRTGAPWEDLPPRYGKRSTVSSRYYRWRTDGVWDRIYDAVKAQADATGELDWDLHHVDATVIRAHQHAAGAKKGTQRPKRWGAARAASVPKSTSAPRATANR
jgi:transposase